MKYVSVVICSVESTRIVVWAIVSKGGPIILKIKSFSSIIGVLLLQYLYTLVSSGHILKTDIFSFTSVKHSFFSLSPNL